jgi:hypothetical protein
VRRVVFDTNISISVFITPSGRGEAVFLRVVKSELLREKFHWDRHLLAQVTVAERMCFLPGNRRHCKGLFGSGLMSQEAGSCASKNSST